MPAPDFCSANAGGAVVSYVLDIDHYWHIKQLHPNGQRFASSPFEAGGFSWRIQYYPNGVSSSCKDCISIFVVLDSRVTGPIKAWSRFTLLDRALEPVPGHSVCTDISQSSEVGASHGCDLFIRKKFLETSGHLYNGDFAIRWDISVDRATPLPYLDRYPWHTDIVFQVRGKTFCAHRCVLAARSPKFEAQLFSETMEPGTAGDYCIKIDDMLPEVFDSLLHFVYTDSLPEMTEEEESWMVEHLLVAANRFGVQHLKLVCEEILCDDINEDTVGIILRFALHYDCRLLRDACIEFLEEPPVLEAVMAGDNDLIELVAKTCPSLLKELWADEDYPMHDELAMCL
ncbi:hypothetical protein HU200_049519 [Digitaria exilis]|uniref:Uncharacterized protein n=1 Tax=Digitaria exilis TaxID=1010633 RepID=A0A835EBW4_9POAL|nr:hypothetical protein HU200_049519 [Digitaria exilis]CAB3499344.1 unnamed protein product [Digitaria exilis]